MIMMMINKTAPNPIDKHVGSRVRMRRMMLGMSQGKLGDALGLTFQQVQKYEKGTNRIGASRLQQISQILQVQKRGELFAAADVALLRARTELASVHVLDHALAQRADGIRTHKETPVLDEVDDTSILKTGHPARYR